MIRAALDLKCGGDHEVEIPPSTTLKEYFGTYLISGKAYRTYGGPNKSFGEIACILMEYAFVHTNPTSMPQNKAAIIINEYKGNKIDWGIIIGEGVRATLPSFQSGKKLLSVMTHFLTVLYPPPSLSSPRALSSPPQPRKQREKLLAINQEALEVPTPPSPPSAARNPTPISAPPPPKTQKQRALPVTCEEWDEAEDVAAKDVTIRQKTPKISVPSPRPIPHPTNQQTSGTRPQKRKQAEKPTPPAPNSQAQPNKKRRINRESTTETEGPQKQKTKEDSQSSLTIVPVEALLHLGKIGH